MAEIFIHVGAGKTGTSALQEFLHLNRAELLDRGVYIPDIGRSESRKFIFHHELAGGRGSSFKMDESLVLWREIAQLPYDKVLISSEIFHSRVKTEKGQAFFRYVRDLLSGWNIYVVFYIRREDQWLQSAYEQWIKSGTKRDGDSIEQFASESRITLPEQVLLFEQIFGLTKVLVRPYEPGQFYEGSIFADFMDAISCSLWKEARYPEKNSNPRLSRDALEFKRIVNTICKDKKEADEIGRLLKRYSNRFDKSSQDVFRSVSLLPLDVRKAIVAHCEPYYADIARRFLGRESGLLFYDPLDESESTYTFGVEDSCRISGFLFVNLLKEIDSLRRKVKILENAE